MVFAKGHPGYKKKGTKHKETLLKEERRAIFDAKISERWEKIIEDLPPTYVADQFLGKAPDRLKIEDALKEDEEAFNEAAKAYGQRALKKRLS